MATEKRASRTKFKCKNSYGDMVMKSFKILVFFLALAALPWAQTSTQKDSTSAPAAQSSAKPECSCCQKMADGKAGTCCCAHQMAGKDGKAMPCCSGKGCMNCMGKNGKCMKAGKNQAGCCANGKGCCMAAKDGDKTMACCGGAQCPMHHEDEPVAK